jgi:hypothetical protein
LKRKTLLEDFLGTECSGCGGEKRSKMSHCSKCYYKLPKTMQAALYKRFGEGYEEAFEASTKYLAEKYPRSPETGRLFES